MSGGTFSEVDEKWALSPEGLSTFRTCTEARSFGLMDKLDSHLPVYNVNVSVHGKAGVGKTATLMHITGRTPAPRHTPTSGKVFCMGACMVYVCVCVIVVIFHGEVDAE